MKLKAMITTIILSKIVEYRVPGMAEHTPAKQINKKQLITSFIKNIQYANNSNLIDILNFQDKKYMNTFKQKERIQTIVELGVKN